MRENVLIIGKGGREHALAWKLSLSPHVGKIYAAPGNGGTAVGLENVSINEENFDDISSFVRERKVRLTIVGPEAPLVKGIVGYFNAKGLVDEGHLIFGPTAESAMIEGSKAFAKDFMKTHNIPTADAMIFSNPEDAKRYLISTDFDKIVVKADGLAAGKGSIVCKTLDEAIKAVDKISAEDTFKDARKYILIEDFLEGEEASILVLTDGISILPLVSSQDHKAIFDGDKGENTGGMGAYAPAPVVDSKVMKKVYEKILNPTVMHLREQSRPFVGCLYAGLMIKDGEPSVVEFNARFGDPETQAILPLIQNDLYELLMSCADKTLNRHVLGALPGSACSVVMASLGYPGNYQKGKLISGLNNLGGLDSALVFHAGTKKAGNEYFTDGGRVLGVTGIGADISEAINNAYSGVDKISWDNEYHRTDIGHKAIGR